MQQCWRAGFFNAAMRWLPYFVAGWLAVIALYGLVTSRNLVHMVACLTVLQSATYLLFVAIGYTRGGEAPIFYDRPADTIVVDALVQAPVPHRHRRRCRYHGPAFGAGPADPSSQGHHLDRGAENEAQMTGDPWLSALLPASVALPLLVAALMVTFASLMPRLLRDAIMLATTLASVGASIWLLIETTSGLPVAHWLSGGSPRNGVVPGIALYVDSPAAAVLSVVGLIFVAVTIYAWRYFKVLEEYFHTMLLVLLGAMTALVMAADLFTMFVAFELMSVIAYALTAFNVEDEDALAGAFNFAILGSIASLLMMVGIAAIYAGTGALNLAAISRTLAGQSSPLASIGPRHGRRRPAPEACRCAAAVLDRRCRDGLALAGGRALLRRP